MVNYENLSTLEVQRLAKQGDPEALFEMVWRFELIQPSGQDSPMANILAWKEYWLEKAADKGHVVARRQYGGLLADFGRPFCTAEQYSADRKKALGYFESLSKERDILAKREENEDLWDVGMVAKIELGIMLCEGNGTRRDCLEGVKQIEKGVAYIDSVRGLGFNHLHRLGELYAMGYTEPNEEPKSSDLAKAIEYLQRAEQKYTEGKDNPKFLDNVKELLKLQRKAIVSRVSSEKNLESLSVEIKNIFDNEQNTYNDKKSKDRREKMGQPLTQMIEMRKQMDDAMHQLRKQLAQQGW